MPQEKLKWAKDKKLDLFIESYSNSARTVQVRGFSNVEQIIANHTTNSDRSLATSTVPISEMPIMLTVRTAETGVKRGACYVKISLRAEGTIIALLFAGYVTDAGAPAYPNGKIESSTEGRGLIRLIVGTNPAAGEEISETVPAGVRWRLISLRAILATNATVANRTPRLQLVDGAHPFFTSGVSATVTASTTSVFSFAVVGQEDTTSPSAAVQCIPDNLILLPDQKITTVTGAMEEGDNWDVPVLLVEEWISP